MFEELKENLKNSYAPYSNYSVSSCLVTKEGKKYFGVNVENASFGGTICAERTAIVKAISAGERKGNFREIHILGSTEVKAMPCFLCRQTFTEFFDEDVLIFVYGIDGSVAEYTMNDLCPFPFSTGE